VPTISVVIPAYNAERTIVETITSVQQQTLSNFELIVINDGSTDRTLELLQSIEDNRLKVFSYENGGLPVARNRGISHATGEFIAFLDADDLWTPDKLELQLAALQQHPEAGVAYSWTSYFLDGEEESTFPFSPIFFEGNVYDKLLVNNFIANGSNILVRRNAIESVGEFEPTLKSSEDWDFYIRLAAKWHFVVVPKHQILYRQSSNAMTSKVEVMEKEALKVVERAYQAAPQEYQFLRNQSLAWIYEYSTQQYLKHSTDLSGVNQAGQKLWKAIRLHPQILLGKYAQSLFRGFIKKWILVWLPLKSS
jgi:glycosyltransferase involved in cell wall biosynthesis